MPHARSLLASLVVFALSLLAALPVSAQDATPAAEPQAGEVLDPALCDVVPRSPESLLALATPAADVSPAATPAPPEIPFGGFQGTPADSETAAAYTAFIREFWTCNGSQDVFQVLALVTDEELRQSFAPEDLLAIAQPEEGTPATGEVDTATTLFAVLGIEELPDGRVGGYSVVDTPFDPLLVEVNYMVAVETADGWRLDDFLCFDEAGDFCA